MNPRRFLLLGAGFWAGYQLAAWGETPGAVCVGVCDRDPERARRLAGRIGAPAFTIPEAALAETRPDFVDIVTSPETHVELIALCAAQNIPILCQKPLAPTLAEAEQVVALCERASVPLLVHENWRWQAPLRHAGLLLQSGAIGRPFRARLMFSSSFPVFDNQPFLRTLDRFILSDVGPHLLDTGRYLFGEATSLYAQTHRINPTIRGEDVATTVTVMGEARITVTCEMSYASRTAHERFPQTYLFVEGETGSLEIAPDYLVTVTNADGSLTRRIPPPRYAWANPAYDVVQASMVPCQADLLAHLISEKTAETTAADNLRTLRLVEAAYESAAGNRVIALPGAAFAAPEE